MEHIELPGGIDYFQRCTGTWMTHWSDIISGVLNIIGVIMLIILCVGAVAGIFLLLRYLIKQRDCRAAWADGFKWCAHIHQCSDEVEAPKQTASSCAGAWNEGYVACLNTNNLVLTEIENQALSANPFMNTNKDKK